ncbi:hypothetical protein ACHAPT_011342 [Fusarium lateritium]
MICNEKSRSLASDVTFTQDKIAADDVESLDLGEPAPTLSAWELLQYFLILNWQLFNALRTYLVYEHWDGWSSVRFTDKAAVVLGVAQLPLTVLILLELVDMWRERRAERRMRLARERVSKC